MSAADNRVILMMALIAFVGIAIAIEPNLVIAKRENEQLTGES